MGKKIDYNPDDWEFQEESDALMETISSSEITLSSDFFDKKIDQTDGNMLSFDAFPDDVEDVDITAYVGGEKIKINHHNSARLPSSQDEEAFRRQIEDLFELLELEKKANKTDGIRVYQTDSSPSRPWRFH